MHHQCIPSTPVLSTSTLPSDPPTVIRGPFAMLRVYGPGEFSVEISHEPLGYAADIYWSDQYCYRCRHMTEGGITRRSCYSETPEAAMQLARSILRTVLTEMAAR